MNPVTQASVHICTNMYEIWTYTATYAYTHPRRYKSPGAVREREIERESWAVRRWLRGVGVFCSTDLLSPSLFSFFYFFFLHYSFDILVDLSSCARKKKSWEIWRDGWTVLLHSVWVTQTDAAFRKLKVSPLVKSTYLIVYASKGIIRGDYLAHLGHSSSTDSLEKSWVIMKLKLVYHSLTRPCLCL